MEKFKIFKRLKTLTNLNPSASCINPTKIVMPLPHLLSTIGDNESYENHPRVTRCDYPLKRLIWTDQNRSSTFWLRKPFLGFLFRGDHKIGWISIGAARHNQPRLLGPGNHVTSRQRVSLAMTRKFSVLCDIRLAILDSIQRFVCYVR